MNIQDEYIFGEPTIRGKNLAVIFPVGFQELIYKCVITCEFLIEHYEASPTKLIESYKINKLEINEIIKRELLSGNVSSNDELTIDLNNINKVYRNKNE